MTQEVKLDKSDYVRIREQLGSARLGTRLTSLLKILVDAAEDPAKDPQPPNGPRIFPQGRKGDYWDAKGAKGLDVRTDIANLRTALERRVWNLSGDRECALSIPDRERTAYRVVAHSLSGMERIWLPHTSLGEPTITLHERLFFRLNDVYVRSTNVNDETELPRLAQELPGIDSVVKELKPSRHYVSSGELYGAIVLQNFMFDQFDSKARISMHSGLPGMMRKENQIVLAASRVDDAELGRQQPEVFAAAETGIVPDYTDTDDHPSRTIHVLLTRRSHEGGIKTILQGAHGRAVQGLCEYLGAADSCESIIGQLGIKEKKLPANLQFVFQVMLTYDRRANVSRPTRVMLCEWANGGARSPIHGALSLR